MIAEGPDMEGGAVAEEKMIERARDELFSHINRCSVLQAAVEDQRQWMDETVDYLGERFPDLSEANLRDLHTVGLRFCRPAIRYGTPSEAPVGETSKPASVKPADAPESAGATESAGAPESAGGAEAPAVEVPEAVAEPEAVEVAVGAAEEA